MRIAVLSRQFVRHLGGAENYAVSLVEQMASQHQITVLCQSHGDVIPGVSYRVMPWRIQRPRWVNQWAFACWTWWQTRRGFDVVHSHENVFHGHVQTVHVKPVAHNLFSRASTTQRVLAGLKALTSPRLMSYLLLERLRFARNPHRLIVAASSSLADVLPQHFRLLPGQLHVLPPGVLLPPVRTPMERQRLREQARRSLGLPLSPRLLLMVGHDYKKKGLGALIKAMQLLPDDYHLVVVGQNAQIPIWQPEVERAGLTGRVHFLGLLMQMQQAYEASDVMVHATLEDVFPMVTLEALAHKLPLIVSRAPYCLSSTLLRHGEDALVLNDPTSGDDIADAVRQLEVHPSLVEHLGRAGRAFASQYAWNTLAQRQLELYRLALRGVS